jgi:ribosomal protein S2
MYSLYKIPASMLMGFGPHFGSLFSVDWNSDSSGFIHSRFQSRFSINLAFSSIMVSKASKFISFFVSRYPKFSYFFSEGFLRSVHRAVRSTYFWKFNFLLIDSWVPGTLTNYKVVRSRSSKLQTRTNLTQCPSGLIFSGDPRFLPTASAEARISKFPSIGLADIDNGFSPFAYTIPSNNKTFGVSNAYYHLFKCAAEYGRALGYEFHTDRVRPKFDLLINQALYILELGVPNTVHIRVQTRRSPRYTIRSKPYRQWWLTSLNKLPLKTFSYRVSNIGPKFRQYNRFVDLCIDLSISAQLVSSAEFWDRLGVIDSRLRESGNRRYQRYLNRRWRSKRGAKYTIR